MRNPNKALHYRGNRIPSEHVRISDALRDRFLVIIGRRKMSTTEACREMSISEKALTKWVGRNCLPPLRQYTVEKWIDEHS